MTDGEKDSGSISGIRRRVVHMALATATVFLLTGLAARPAQAQADAPTYTVLYTFTGGPDGGGPDAGLVPDTAGNFYGTTALGGNLSCNGGSGCGVAFRLGPTGKETVLHTFTGGTDGSLPVASLIPDGAANLYGTAADGGDLGCNAGFGCGVVFKLGPARTETVLHTFTGGDGANPVAGLIRDAAGNLYGTTDAGGDLGCGGGFGCGVVFELNMAGNETVLYTFSGGADGAQPLASLIRDAAGDLYGTTEAGGNSGCYGGGGCGVVFKLDPAGNETILYSFTGGADGGSPEASLIRDAAGNLYGTTAEYGPNSFGVVFRLDPTGRETVLHGFAGGADGAIPRSALLPYNGALYGTTSEGGGALGGGVVFKLTLR